MFKKILIANRGEIACRVIRTVAGAWGIANGGGLFPTPTRNALQGALQRRGRGDSISDPAPAAAVLYSTSNA